MGAGAGLQLLPPGRRPRRPPGLPLRVQAAVRSRGEPRGRDRQGRARPRPLRTTLRRCPRGGKLPALNKTVAETDSEVVAFTDANTAWASDALRKLVSNFADDDVAYVCGRLMLQAADGQNREGVYWRYELWLRESES